MYCSVHVHVYQRPWASEQNQLGLFKYISYSEKDFDVFGSMYNYNGGSAGYVKPNLDASAHAESRDWPVNMDGLYQDAGNNGQQSAVVVSLL